MGDDGRYNMTGIGIVTFERESSSPLRLKDVMFVSGLKKNLVSITTLEDHDYDVIFNKRKAFVRHITMEKLKKIGVLVKNLYKLDVKSVWEVVPRPEEKSVVGSKWIYKVKKVVNKIIEKHKARFVAKGFSQVEGNHYEETFAPVARYSSIISILALALQMAWKIH
eukprot:PITA_16437